MGMRQFEWQTSNILVVLCRCMARNRIKQVGTRAIDGSLPYHEYDHTRQTVLAELAELRTAGV